MVWPHIDETYYETLKSKEVFTQEDIDTICNWLWYHGIVIEDGIVDNLPSEKEHEENFTQYVNILKEIMHDNETYEIIFDITHWYRSIPVYIASVIELFKVTHKNISVTNVYYGAYENQESGITPVVELNSIYNIHDWSKAVDKFIDRWDATNIAELIYKENSSLAQAFTQVSACLNLWFNSNLHLYLEDLQKELDKEKNMFQLRLFISHIEKLIHRFLDLVETSDIQYECSKWYYENKDYGKSYLALTEAVVSFVCEINGLDTSLYIDRNKAKTILYQEMDETKLLNYFKMLNERRRIVAHSDVEHEVSEDNYEYNQILLLKELLEKYNEYISEIKDSI